MLISTLLPVWYSYLLFATFGAIIGSFINVVGYRMHTGVSINGRSRCFSCAKTLQWYELVPLVSYLMQRGCCRGCSAQIPRRDFWVELVMAGLFVLIASWAESWLMLAVTAVLATILVLVVIYDVVHLIIPNELVMLIAALGLGTLVWQSLTTFSLQTLGTLGLSIFLAAVVYLVLWSISRGRWIGFGDVKLAAALGVWLTPLGAFSMVIFSFWIGAVIGLALMAPSWFAHLRQRFYPRSTRFPAAQSYTMKSEIPFAPFIVLAFGVVYLYDVTALSFITNVFTYFF